MAQASGASFIRVNVLCGARVADQGLIQGIAHNLGRERAILGATNVKIFADVDVKHSAALADRPLQDEVADLIERALADAIVVSGAGTGKATDPAQARLVKSIASDTPVFIGSGITPETISQFVDSADGFIVGTALSRSRNERGGVIAREIADAIVALTHLGETERWFRLVRIMRASRRVKLRRRVVSPAEKAAPLRKVAPIR